MRKNGVFGYFRDIRQLCCQTVALAVPLLTSGKRT